jgi:acetoacetyl-CoA synthetase
VNQEQGLKLSNYWDLHQFSIDYSDNFWRLCADYCGAVGDFSGPERVGESMVDTQWFPEVKLNFAETMLSRRDEKVSAKFNFTSGNHWVSTIDSPTRSGPEKSPTAPQ